MTTPPQVTAEDAETAAQRIYARHAAADDPYLHRLGTEPREIIDYLRRYATSWPALLADDLAEDAPVLQVRLWWLHQQRERWMFDAAVRHGIDRAQFGARFGLRSRAQGFRDRRDRLHQLLEATGAGRPDERQARADRAAVSADESWLMQNAGSVREVAQACVELEPFGTDEAAEWLQEVREDLTQGAVGAGAFAVVSAAVEALDASPGIRAVTAWPRVRERWRRLTAERALLSRGPS